jgi:hypothetical protein
LFFGWWKRVYLWAQHLWITSLLVLMRAVYCGHDVLADYESQGS